MSLEVAVFEDTPDEGWITAVSLGLSSLPADTPRFELLLVLRSREAQRWGSWLGDVVASPKARSLRPRCLGAPPSPQDEPSISGFVSGPPHWSRLRLGKLTEGLDRIRLLQLYPLFDPREVAAVRRSGVRSYLSCAWEVEPELLFDPARSPFTSVTKQEVEGEALFRKWP